MLETRRLLLRRLAIDDVQAIYDLLKDGEVSKTTSFSPRYTVEMAQQFVNGLNKAIDDGRIYGFGIECKESNELIGTITINNVDGVGEIGYWIGVKYWNQGFASEAAQEILNYAFNNLGYHKVFGSCHVWNVSSSKVLRKLGMIKEGTLREHICKDGEYHDLDVYGILREEYMSMKKK